jgi:two-component system sensor histidine kinase FlrB
MGKMVAYLAHQIRTPLSAAMLYGGHLSAGTLSKDKQMEFAAKLVKQHRHLEQQIKDLLIFARGEILYKEEAAVADILQEIKCSTELLITQSGLSCQFASDLKGARIHCNSESLVGAVVNLVNNAIEAANGNVRIRVTAMLAEREGRPSLVLSVEDDGPGICQENLSKVLEPFYTTKSKGTGLGLAVVQAVARSHDGTLLLESKQGEGTLASLMLPVIESAAGAPAVADDSA